MQVLSSFNQAQAQAQANEQAQAQANEQAQAQGQTRITPNRPPRTEGLTPIKDWSVKLRAEYMELRVASNERRKALYLSQRRSPFPPEAKDVERGSGCVADLPYCAK